MNEFALNNGLRRIIRDILGMGENTVRPAHQNAPIYKGEEYITVQIQSEVAEGTDNTAWVDAPGDSPLLATEHVYGQRLMSANIQYYNGDGMLRLRTLTSRLQSMTGTQQLDDAGFGFVRATITDLTGLLPDEMWQTRAVLRFDFYAVVEDFVKTPLIVQVPLTTITERGGIVQEVIVPPLGIAAAQESAPQPAPFLAFETGGGDTIRLQEVNP